MIRYDDTIYVNGDVYTRIPKQKSSYEKAIIREIERLEYVKRICQSETLRERSNEEILFWKEVLREEGNKPHEPHRAPKRRIKKLTDEHAKEMIFGYIRDVYDGRISGYFRAGYKKAVSKEAISKALILPESQVEKIFMVLNREGILSQRNAHYAHDTNRNNFSYGGSSGWAADYYVILKLK